MKKNWLLLCTVYSIYFAHILQAVSTPIISRVRGDYFARQISQMPLLGTIGALDTIFGDSYSGSLAIGSIGTNAIAYGVQALNDGTFVALLSDASNSYLAKFTQAGVVESTYSAGTGFGTNGICTLTGNLLASSSVVIDGQGRFVVGGNAGGGSTSWVSRVTAAGNVDGSFSWTDGSHWAGGMNAIVQQSTGKVIIVGKGSNAQLGRYNLNGSLDTSFGVSGYAIFNGSNDVNVHAYPTTTNQLYNVIIDANDLIYILYILNDATTVQVTRLTASGALDTTFNSGSATFVISALSSATSSSLRSAFDLHGNIILAGIVSNSIKVTGVTTSAGSIGGFTDFNSNPTINTNNFQLQYLLTTTDGTTGKIIVAGSDTTNKKMVMIRLTAAGALDNTSNDALDTFNGVGYNEFLAGSSSSILYGAAVASDGRLYGVGVKNNGSNVAYVSRLNNNSYVSSVAQYPFAQEQGILDPTFGGASIETNAGVVTPFHGIYGASLQQKPQAIIELDHAGPSGSLLVGMHGKLDTNNNSNMMLARLTSEGVLDTTFNTTGIVALTKHQTDEYLSAVLEDATGNIYVTGYGTTGAIVRKYTSAGVETWVGDDSSAGNQGVGIVLQGSARLLLFKQLSGGTTGQISGHKLSDGTLDTMFGVAGVVATSAFSLNMGPLYAAVVNPSGNIIVAYKNSSTGTIDIAALYPSGTSLITEFGTNGILTNVFSTTSIAANNIRMVLDKNHDIVVVGSTGTDLQLARLDGTLCVYDDEFNSGSVLVIPSVGTSINLKHITAVSDESILIGCYDDLSDDIMLMARVLSTGASLDSSFNSQGATPGILPMQIGHRSATYYERVMAGMAIQSATGNVVAIGYEQQRSSDATPLVMRIFGQSGTTEVKASQLITQTPGALDVTFGNNAGAQNLTTLLGAGSLKVVYAYRDQNANQGKLLLGIDISSSSSVVIARVDSSNMSLDETFGSGGILTLSSLSGLHCISIDNNNGILIAGTYAGAGWARRVADTGVVDAVFTMPSNVAAINVMYQQKASRYLFAGTDGSGNGILVAFENLIAGPLGIDTTFNAAGSVPSRYTIGTTGLVTMTINDDYSIIVAYSDTISGHVKIAKIQDNGSGLVSAFGTAGVIDTGIVPANITDIVVGKDSNNKVVIASLISGNAVSVCRYTSSGGVDSSFNSTGAVKTISGLGSAGVRLRHVMVTNETSGQDKIIILGDNTSGANGPLFIACLAGNGSLDTTWNILPASPDIIGITTLNISGATYLYWASIAINGDIYIAATNTGGTVPLLIRLFAADYIVESEQTSFVPSSGTIDTSLASPAADNLILNNQTGLSGLFGAVPKAFHIFSDQTYLALAQDGTNSYVARLDTTFNVVSGFNSSALKTIAGKSSINGLVMDQISNTTDTLQSFYVVGTNAGAPWVKHYNYAGTENANFNFVPYASMTEGNTIVQQSCGRVIIGGTDGTYGIITGHTITGTIDQFGVHGKYVVANSSNIHAMTIDNQDRLVVAFKNGSNVNVRRIYANGGGADTTFVPADGDRISGVTSDDQIKIALDQNGDVIVAAATATAYKVRRYLAVDGSLDTTFNGTGELSFHYSGSLGTPKITNMFVVLESGKIFILGYNASSGDNRSLIARLYTNGGLDQLFDPQGVVRGITELHTVGEGLQYYGVALNINNILLLGVDTISTNMVVARLFSDEDLYWQAVDHVEVVEISGQFDTEFNSIGSFDLSGLSGVGYNKAKVVRTTSGARTLVAIDTGSVTKLVGLGGQNALDTTFNGSGIAVSTSPSGVTDMFIDQNEKILVCGTASGVSWLHRYNSDGSNDTTFGTNGVVTSTIAVGNIVRQQSNGRLIVGGFDGVHGAFIGYNLSGLLDLSFGTRTAGSGTGIMATATTNQIYSFCIDSSDRIIAVYYNGTDVTLVRYYSDGTGIDTTFGIAGLVVNALGATITGANQVRIGLDPNGKIVVVGTTSSSVILARYSSSGVLDTAFGTSGHTTLSRSGVTISDFLIGQDALLAQGQITQSKGKIVVVGYQDTADDAMFVAWFTQDGVLDTTFNPTTVVEGGPGYATFEVNESNTIRQLCSGVILANGKLLLAGYENTGSQDVPLLVQFYGQFYANQQAQVPAAATAGIFDNGLHMNGHYSFTFGTGSVQQYAQTIWPLNNGYFYVGGYGTTSTDPVYNHFLIEKIDTSGNVDTSFGTAGSINIPLLTAATDEYVYDLVVDDDNNIVVAGYQNSGSGIGLIRRYDSSGTLDVTFGDRVGTFGTPTGTVATPATQLYAVGLQSTGRIIAVGQDSRALNKGMVVAYTTSGVLDQTFGLNGQWLIDDAVAIYSFDIDEFDNIVVVYKNSSDDTASIARIPYNGNQYDLSFGTSGKVANIFGGAINSTDTIKIIIDKDQKIVVAASMNGANTVKIRRYLSTGAVDTSFNGTGAALTITSGLAADRTMVKRLLSNSEGQYILVGYQDIAASDPVDEFWIAQVTNAGIIDPLFNPASLTQAGENLFAINGSGSLQKLMGAAISMEGKIVAIGQETVASYSGPVMAVLFDSQYILETEHMPTALDDGAFDPGFGTSGAITLYANGATLPTANQQAVAVRILSNGQSMAVVNDGVNAWTLRVNSDSSVDSTYGSTGVVIGKTTGNETVTRMEIDGIGRMLVIGTNSVAGGFVKRLNSDGSLDTTFNPSGIVPGAIYGIMTTPYSVVELKTCQIMVAGVNSGVGTAIMYTAIGAVDSSFNSGGTYTNGLAIPSIAVDDNDTIFMASAYLSSGVKKVRLIEMDITGTLSSTFGSGGIVDPAISNIDAYANVRIALNDGPGVVVAASWNGSSGKIGVCRYDEFGNVSSNFNSGSQFDITYTTSVVLTDLVTLQDGRIMIGGYQNGASPSNYLVLARLTGLGVLDTNFNSTGKQIFQVDTTAQASRVMNNIMIQRDGKIVASVSESPTAGQNVPSLVRVYGDAYVWAVAQFPGAGTPGTADISFGRLQEGISKVYFSTDIDLAQFGKGVAISRQGQIILLGNGYSDIDRTYQHYMFARLQMNGLLDPNIGGAFNGAVPGTVITQKISANSEIVRHSLVDQLGRIVVAGYINSGTNQALIRRYNPSGILDNSFGNSRTGVTHATVEQFNVVGIQGLGGRIILGGTQSSQGVLVAYKTDGTLDTRFGTNGVYTFSDSTDIRAILIGAGDVIYVARKVGADLKISAVAANGTGLLTSFGTAGQITAITNVNGTDKVWIAVDGNGKIVVAATVISGSDSRIQVARYSTAGVADSGFNGGSQFTLFTGSQSDRTNVVTKVMITTDNKIIIVGYQDITASTTDNMFVARILSDGSALDTTFNPHGSIPGLYTLRVYQTGQNSQFTDAQIQADGKIVLVGNEAPSFGGNTPVVIRLHGNINIGAVSQLPAYVNDRPNTQTSGPGGDGVGNTLGNSLSSTTSGTAAHPYSGGWSANHGNKNKLIAVYSVGRLKNPHAFSSDLWAKTAPRWKHRLQ